MIDCSNGSAALGDTPLLRVNDGYYNGETAQAAACEPPGGETVDDAVGFEEVVEVAVSSLQVQAARLGLPVDRVSQQLRAVAQRNRPSIELRAEEMNTDTFQLIVELLKSVLVDWWQTGNEPVSPRRRQAVRPSRISATA